jgi:AraC-like DNA-binding protein
MKPDVVDLRCAPDLDNMEFLSAVYTRHEFSKHMHDTYAFGVIDGGTGRVWCGGNTHVGTAGDFISIAPGVVHTGAEGHRRENVPFRYRMIYPSFRLFASATGQLERPNAELQGGEPMHRDRTVAGRFNQLFSALRRNTSRLEIESLFLAFVDQLRVRRIEASRETQSAVRRGKTLPRFIVRVRDYLDANTHVNVSLAGLAQIAGVHPLYLCRVFAAHVGLAPHAYALHARLLRARALLREGRPVSDVAAATGFADQSHFGRHFLRTAGITPGSYRQMVFGSKDRSST